MQQTGWVDMVEAARKMTCGMFGMLYMDRAGLLCFHPLGQ